MNLRTRTSDALIGLLVIGAVVVLIVSVVVTQGWTERRVTIYMLSPSVQDLKEDTPVLLQGLLIGEVSAISPKADSVVMGAPEFIVALRVRERYQNGVPIRLPLGTMGKIASSGLIGAASISLEVPKNDVGAAIEPGDTILGQLALGWTDVLKEVADTLKTQVSDILKDTRKLMASLDRTANAAGTELAATAPEMRQTLATARAVLERIEPMIAQGGRTLATTDTTIGLMRDSLALLLSDTRRLLGHADTLTASLTRTSAEITPDVRQTMRNVYILSAKLDWFMDQVTRRPHRLLTGVRPLPSDSIPATTAP